MVNLINSIKCNKVLSAILLSLFWIFVFIVLMINYWNSGTIFTGNNNHDFHWSFITYLAGMSSLGFWPGIDFISTHGELAPFFQGLYLRIAGVNQVNMAIGTGMIIFISFIFIYKTSRFVLSPIWGGVSIFIILLSYTGREVPWFNDIVIAFVAFAVYFFASYINSEKNYKLIMVGLFIFILPYIRQQALAISLVFCILPLFAYYFKLFDAVKLKRSLIFITGSFLIFNFIFIMVVILGGKGLILYDSFFHTFAQAQPTIISSLQKPLLEQLYFLIDRLFGYYVVSEDFYGPFAGFFQYWFLFFLSALYFFVRPINLNVEPCAVTKEDFVRFICASAVLSTIVFNYPINEEIRNKAHFSIGVWLLVDMILLLFYDKRNIFFGIVVVVFILIFINNSRLTFAYAKFIQNIDRVVVNKENLIRMPKGSAFKGMLFDKATSEKIFVALDALHRAERAFPESPVIFNGNLYGAGVYVYLYFSGEKKTLQHPEPYYFHARASNERNYDATYGDYLKKIKPIVIDCSGAPIPQGYMNSYSIPDTMCGILIPQAQ